MSSILFEFDPNGSVSATVAWVSSYLETTEYSDLLHDQAIDGDTLTFLASSPESLTRAGFSKMGHAVRLFKFFARREKSHPPAEEFHVPFSRWATPLSDARAETATDRQSSAPKLSTYSETIKTNEQHDFALRQTQPSTTMSTVNSQENVSMFILLIFSSVIHSSEIFFALELLLCRLFCSECLPCPNSQDWPSYDSIFSNRLKGKAMLKEKYPDALEKLHQGHRIIRSWFKNHTIDSVQYDILNSDFKKKSEMRKVLTDFIAARYHELPPLLFEKQEGKDKCSYSMKWSHDTVYQYIIAHRQELKKSNKRKSRTVTNSKSESITESGGNQSIYLRFVQLGI